jgi:hypothetical protein
MVGADTTRTLVAGAGRRVAWRAGLAQAQTDYPKAGYLAAVARVVPGAAQRRHHP